MPPHPHQLVQLAERVRRLWESVQLVTRTADDLHLTKQRDQLFDVELQLMDLHSQLLHLAANPRAASLLQERPEHQEELPF